VLEAGRIFAALAATDPGLSTDVFTGTPAQLEELRQRLASRQGRY